LRETKPGFSLETMRVRQSLGKVTAKYENLPSAFAVISSADEYAPESKAAVRFVPVKETAVPFTEYCARIGDRGRRVNTIVVNAGMSRTQIVSPAFTWNLRNVTDEVRASK
jgi:hypothetical protein